MKKITLSLFALSLLLISCNETESSSENVKEPIETTIANSEETIAETEVVEDVVSDHVNSIDIKIEANDQMKFNLSEIKVTARSVVNLTLVHVGKLPITTMGHNFVLLKKGTNVAEFAVAAMAAKDNGYVPLNTTDVIAYTEVVGGGSSTTLSFTTPEAGEYDFICSFPGHYSIMKGLFIVE